MPSEASGPAASPTLGFGADAAAMIERVRQGMALHQAGDFAGAARAYQRVLDRYPGHADVIHYLGMAEYKQGHKERARELLMRSIALDGRKSIVHVNLGRIDLNEGEAESAMPHLRRAVELDPRDWEAQHMLGRALLATDQPFEAAAALERAAVLRAGSAAVMLDLAHAYGSCRRHPIAVETFRRLLALEPHNVEALGGISFSLRAMNRGEEALPFLEKATQLDAQQPNWMCDLGSLREELGDFDEAIRLFNLVLEQRPNYPIAVARLLSLRKGAEDPSLLGKAQRHIETGGIVKPVRVQLEFALGKHFDSTGDYDRAFEHYAAANELVAAGRRYRPLAMETQVGRMISGFTRRLFADKRPSGNPSDRPLLVVGMPRSGTTLTEQILASHRDVAGAGELGYFGHMAYVLSKRCGNEADPLGYAQNLDAAALAESAAGYLAQLAEVSADAKRVVDKMPMNFMHLGLIALMFPNARIIHCRRDALDTCLSCYFENFSEDQRYSTKLESLGHYYRQYERLMAHWNAVLPQPILEVRYEDTIAGVEAQARRMIAFCGLEWDDNCLSFHRTARAVNTPSRWQVRQPIYGSSVERWRRYEKHLEPLRAALAPGA